MKHHTIPFLLAAYALLAVTAADSQTKWLKCDGNPILNVGSSGAWDGLSVHPSRIVLEDSVYRMWYTGWNGTNLRIGHATSIDGVTWTKDTLNPVLSGGPPGSWESVGTMDAYVVHTTSGYKMWYTGVNASSLYGIGYATSPDGIAWTKAGSANPVLTQGSWYTRGPDMPSVLGPDSVGGFKMWFTGEPLVHADFQIGYATATNETTWTPLANPVFSYGSPGSWDDDKVFYPRVLHNGQSFEMFYVGERSDGRSQFGYAMSVDGLSWTRSPENPVLRRGPMTWDAQDFYALEILLHQGMYHMWYGGTSVFGAIQWRGGYAVSPKGMAVSVSPQSLNVGDSVWVRARVDSPAGLSFSAEIEYPDGNVIAPFELFDDGMHGDSLAGDGIFANNWVPTEAHTYFVDLKLQWNTRSFEMNNAVSFDVITDVAEESTLPKSFYLDQNYPNPFNPSTTIEFSLPHSEFVTLKVFNLLGEEITVLVSQRLPAGTHQTEWGAQGSPSGVYFYRLQAGLFIQTRKLLLLR